MSNTTLNFNPDSSSPSIIIAENNTIYLNALKEGLENHGIKVVAAAANGKELLFQLKYNVPDIILLDLEMPVMNGSDALIHLQKYFPKIKIIIISVHQSPILIHHFIAKGVNAYICKDKMDSVDDFASIIYRVNHEGFYHENLPKPEVEITPKELEVIQHMVKGMNTKKIAATMGVSEKSIHKHRINLYAKTNCKKIEGLVRFVYNNALNFIRY